MSMLADRRKKVNWVLNPRNTHWTADTSKYGLRLMEKMGWTEGSGLGAKEQGSTDYIKVTVRSDNRGVGFKDRPEDDLVHQSEFSDLLQQLASETPPLEGSGDEKKSGKIASLEEKSQMSRSRVHYRKFTRGKDLSRYSEKDLANIIGRPAPLNSVSNTVSVEEKNETEFESDVQTVKGGSMYDYFRNKMAGNGLKERSGGIAMHNETDDDLLETDTGEKEKKVENVIKNTDQCTLEVKLNDVENSDSDESRKEKKRRRKAQKKLKHSDQVIETEKTIDEGKGKISDVELMSVSESCEGAVESAADGVVTRKERKKKRKAEMALKYSEQQAEVEDKQNVESAFDDNGQTIENGKSGVDVETLAEKKRERKRLKKVQRALQNSQQNSELEITTDSNDREISLLPTEQAQDNQEAFENKNRKKKNKKVACYNGESIQNDSEILVESNVDLVVTEVEQTRKSKKAKKVRTQVTVDPEEKNDDARIKKKNKQKESEDLPESEVKPGNNKKQKKEFLSNIGQEDDVEKGSVVEEEGIVVDNHSKQDPKSAKRNPEMVGDELHSEGNVVELNKLQEVGSEMPVEIDVGPQVAGGARSKKAKKRKQQNFTEPLQPGLEASGKLSGISNTEIEYSIPTKSAKIPKQTDGKVKNSETSEEDANIIDEIVEPTVKSKKEKRRKHTDKEGPSSEIVNGTNCVLKEEAEQVVETKKDRKRKRNNKDIQDLKTHSETVDGVQNDIECTKEKGGKKKDKRKDREEASSSAVKHGPSDGNTEVAEEIFRESQNQVSKNVDFEDRQMDIVEAEKVVSIDAAGTEFKVQQSVLGKNINVYSKRENKAGEDANNDALKENEQVLPCGSQSTTLKKSVSVVKLNGKVYVNGICEFDLPKPELNNSDLKKIPSDLQEGVVFLPIPGANVDKFGYVGLQFNKA